MRRSFAKPALMLALVATLLRGLLPAGWMPNLHGDAATPLVICTMDGMRHLPPAPHHAPHDDQDHASAPCPFAAAAPLAPPAPAPVLFQPDRLAFAPPPARDTRVPEFRASIVYPARAPPLFA
jgi:hypothetical protein